MRTAQALAADLLAKRDTATLLVHTLGSFAVWRDGHKLSPKDWKRDKALQLFQFLLMARSRKALHKEQIIDKLWDGELDDQGFKVALHGLNKALEPTRKSHADTTYIVRNGQTYQLDMTHIWVDAVVFEQLLALANKELVSDPAAAAAIYREALSLHKGIFLPDRIYEDWSCDERERLQLLFLGAAMALAELLLTVNPMESIQLCQEVLLIDVAWEEAYRIQMAAYLHKGNRPMAIKSFQVCERVLWEEMGIKPLPETRQTYQRVMAAG